MNGLIILSLSALVVGVTMGLLGSGGSILTVPILVYLVGLDEKIAIASSLAIVGAIAALTSLLNIRSGSIDWRTTVWFGVPGVAGTYGGAAVSEFASGAFQLLVFAGVMLMSAYFMLRPPRLKSEPVPQKIWVIICEGLVIGGLTGFVGVGGGFLIVPALVLLGGLSLPRAAATSLIIIAVKSGAGLIKYLTQHQIASRARLWPLSVIFYVPRLAQRTRTPHGHDVFFPHIKYMREKRKL